MLRLLFLWWFICDRLTHTHTLIWETPTLSWVEKGVLFCCCQKSLSHLRTHNHVHMWKVPIVWVGCMLCRGVGEILCPYIGVPWGWRAKLPQCNIGELGKPWVVYCLSNMDTYFLQVRTMLLCFSSAEQLLHCQIWLALSSCLAHYVIPDWLESGSQRQEMAPLKQGGRENTAGRVHFRGLFS